MAVESIKKRRIARTLANQNIPLCEMFMCNGAKAYKRRRNKANTLAAAGAPDDILPNGSTRSDAVANIRQDGRTLLRRAINMPNTVRSEYDDLIANLTIQEGSLSGAEAYLDAALAAYDSGSTTRVEIETHLDEMDVIADAAIAGRGAGWTRVQMANHLIANTQDNDKLYALRHSPTLVDKWDGS